MRCCFKLLLILLLHHRLNLQRQTEQVDEARGILVAVQVMAVAEGSDFLHVQAVRRLHARVDAVPLYSFSFTVPLTACCVLSTNAESASRRGVYHMPSYTSSANLLATSSL